MAVCLKGSDCGLLAPFPVTPIDWRWETLGPALARAASLLPTLRQVYDLEKMTVTYSSNASTMNILTDVATTLEHTEFDTYNAMFSCHAAVVENCAQELEVCDCHAHIWHQKKSFQKRTAEFQAQTGHTTCVFKGRRGPWFVQRGLKALLDKIPSATSMEFERSLASLPEQKQADVLTVRQQLRSRLLEMFTDKFTCWKHIPWSMLGIFYSENGSWAASKELAVACIAEYDIVIGKSSYNALHRVAHAVLNPDSEVGRDVREFAVDNLPLTAHPVAYFALQKYSLVPLVERRIESVHATVKRLGKQAINVGVPWISSKVREQLLMNQLADQDFRRCCLDAF